MCKLLRQAREQKSRPCVARTCAALAHPHASASSSYDNIVPWICSLRSASHRCPPRRHSMDLRPLQLAQWTQTILGCKDLARLDSHRRCRDTVTYANQTPRNTELQKALFTEFDPQQGLVQRADVSLHLRARSAKDTNLCISIIRTLGLGINAKASFSHCRQSHLLVDG